MKCCGGLLLRGVWPSSLFQSEDEPEGVSSRGWEEAPFRVFLGDKLSSRPGPKELEIAAIDISSVTIKR